MALSLVSMGLEVLFVSVLLGAESSVFSPFGASILVGFVSFYAAMPTNFTFAASDFKSGVKPSVREV